MTWIIVPMFFALAWGMKFVLAFFLLTPLWAAGARRLQDTGEARKDIFIPAGVFFGPPIGLATCLVNAIFLNSFIGFLLLIFLFVLMIYFSFLPLLRSLNQRQASPSSHLNGVTTGSVQPQTSTVSNVSGCAGVVSLSAIAMPPVPPATSRAPPRSENRQGPTPP